MNHQPFVAWLVSNEYSPATIQKYTRALARFFAETGAGPASAAALCAPQNRGGCVPAGPVRFSRRGPPWRTMFAATVSACCKRLAARLPQHPPFGIRPQPCSGAQRAPQNRGPVRREPATL